MELRIRNPYINKFLHGFSDQNELKIIKYLTILGISTLETNKKLDISFSELKALAKNISKKYSKEKNPISKELHIIQNELAKLNQKFEGKSKEEDSDLENTMNQRSTSVPGNNFQKALTQKPPLKTKANQSEKLYEKEKKIPHHAKKVNPIEPLLNIDHQETNQKASKQTYSITPKPNEISFPIADYRGLRYVTKHHLDDSETKYILAEGENVCYPPREKTPEKRIEEHKEGKFSSNNKMNKENKIPPRHVAFSDKKLSKTEIEAINKQRSPLELGNLPKSLKFAQETENISKTPAKDSYRANLPNQQLLKYKEVGNKPPKLADRGTPQRDSISKSQQQIWREKAKIVGKNALNQIRKDHLRKSSSEYRHVGSKIRDEINYDKELSRQYKKMRRSIQNLNEYSPGKYSEENSRVENPQEKFIFVSKRRNHSSNHHASNVSDSPASDFYHREREQSSPNQLSERSPYQNISYARSTKKSEPRRNYENLNQSKNSGTQGFGGMLDIANSFLNSPFMKHLSNLDEKNSEISSPTSSINPSASVSVRGNTYDSYRDEMSSRLRPSPKRDYVKVDKRNNEGRYKNSSILGESANKKYTSYLDKEPGSAYKKNEVTSLASSHFSNFLNEDMKGFFQKETLDLKKPKQSRHMDRASVDSSQISFTPNEMSANSRLGKYGQHRKNSYSNHHNGSKVNDRDLPSDNPNVFNQERMNVTHLLNT